MENCPGSRVNVVTAVIAGIRRAARYPVVLGSSITLVAVDAFRIQKLPQPLKTSGIVWKLGFEVANCVANRFAFNMIPELSVGHELRLPW